MQKKLIDMYQKVSISKFRLPLMPTSKVMFSWFL